MPPKGKSKAQAKKSCFIGQHSKNNNIARSIDGTLAEQKSIILEKQKEIEKQRIEIDQLIVESKELSKVIDNTKHTVRDKNNILKTVQLNLSTANSQIISTKEESSKKVCFSLSNGTRKRRSMAPTSENSSLKTKFLRRNETWEVCKAIHGATPENIGPVLTGMLDTLSAKCKVNTLTKNILASKEIVVRSLRTNVNKEWCTKYEKSRQNVFRSLSVYYSHDVMGKRKYLNVRKANKTVQFQNVKLPNYISYTDLAREINSIDIGTIFDLKPSLTEGIEDKDIADGSYRLCYEFVLRLAKFYISVNSNRTDKLKSFQNFTKKDQESLLFILALGGDGAPISGTTFLVSFLNVGERIASSSENFLLFGANVDEGSLIVRRFIMKLVNDLKYLESQVFKINVLQNCYKVEFRVGEIPNDMKMVACLAGELSNASYYFCTFGNVNKDDANDYKKSFGFSPDSDWKPFLYSKRLQDVQKVLKKKNELKSSKSLPATKRSNLTNFISKTLHSRQEEVPIIGEYIDRVKCEPLHLKNNVVKEMFLKLMKICTGHSNLKNLKSFSEIPENSLFVKFTKFVREEMNSNFLSKKIRIWFNDNKGKVEQDFSFRFRGKESGNYLKHFPELIKMILSNLEEDTVVYRLYQILYQSICLRKVISYAVRIQSFSEVLLQDMKTECKKLFRSCCLFEQRISPSLWALCQAAPMHATITLTEYGYGLGCNTMEGREQKHQMVKKYAENTTYQNRWPLIFRHEFLQLIHLRENGYDKINYLSRKGKYIPDLNDNSCTSCHLRFSHDKVCILCSSIVMRRVEQALENLKN